MKIKKIIEFHERITKIVKFIEFHANHENQDNYRIPCENLKKQKFCRIS